MSAYMQPNAGLNRTEGHAPLGAAKRCQECWPGHFCLSAVGERVVQDGNR